LSCGFCYKHELIWFGVSNLLVLNIYPFILSVAIAWGMKFAFKIMTKPVTQAAIVISVIALSSGSLATIAIFLGTLARILCAIVLAVIIYLALCLAPP
jgi:hypothetical protein